MNESKIKKMLRLLMQQYEQDPLFYTTSSSLRAALDEPVVEIWPYAMALTEAGYAQRLETPRTFLIKLNERGHRALMSCEG